MTQLAWVALRDRASLTASVQNLVQLAVPCPDQAPTILGQQTLLIKDHRQANLAWELASGPTSGIRRTLMDRGLEATLLQRDHSTVLAREPASAKRQETIQLALLLDQEPM